MEKLVDSGLLTGWIDGHHQPEIADEDRWAGSSPAGARAPGFDHPHAGAYVGSCGALDMVNFWAMDTVPAQFRGRNLYRHTRTSP